MTSPTKQNASPGRDSVASGHVTYNEELGTYWTEFDGHGLKPTEAVAYAVAEASQTDPLDLPPIYSVLDTDALNSLVETSTSSRFQTELTVSFEYADYRVILKEHGRIVITPSSAGKR